MSFYAEWQGKWAYFKAIGYFCSYVPEELLIAAGFNPIRILPGVTDASLSQTHLQSYTCYLSRACLHRALMGELDFLSGVIFAHTCDTMQGLADIWLQARPGTFVETFNFPTVLNSEKAIHYTIAELERLKKRLEDLTGKTIEEESLREAIKLVNKKRALLQSLASKREKLPASLYFRIVNQAITMPVEEAINFLETVGLEPEEKPQDKIRILLAGSTLDDMVLVEFVEESGGKIVEDDFCNGTRYFQTLTDETLPPMEAIARRLMERPLCPCKFLRTGAYSRSLMEKAYKVQAHGVILIRQKFCDPWGWEFPLMQSVFREKQIPLLMVETEQPGAPGPAATRIQAFLEMLKGG